jgi:hypothetical protein
LKDYVYNYGPKYTEALKANDEVWGTSSAVQYARNQALKDANAEYAKTGDLEAYKKKLTEIKDTYGPMDDAITAAKDAVLLLKDAMDRLVDKIIHIDIITKYSYVQPTPGHPDVPSYPTPGHKEGDPAGGENYWHWNGTAWVVVHGYQLGGKIGAGEIAKVGEAGPEWFMSDTAGQILTQMQFVNQMSMSLASLPRIPAPEINVTLSAPQQPSGRNAGKSNNTNNSNTYNYHLATQTMTSSDELVHKFNLMRAMARMG